MNQPILLIEDNEHNICLLRYLLEAHGWRVAHASDGPTGIALAGTLRPCLVLLDIQLPGMDGYAVARALRHDPALATTPIVAVTSFALAGDRERSLAAGCNGYIEKPIDPDTFVTEVQRHLEAPPACMESA